MSSSSRRRTARARHDHGLRGPGIGRRLREIVEQRAEQAFHSGSNRRAEASGPDNAMPCRIRDQTREARRDIEARQHNKAARGAEPARIGEVRSDAKSVRLVGSFGLSKLRPKLYPGRVLNRFLSVNETRLSMRYSVEIKKFLYSQYFYGGLRIAVGVLVTSGAARRSCFSISRAGLHDCDGRARRTCRRHAGPAQVQAQRDAGVLR